MTLLVFAVAALWALVLVLATVIVVMLRQIGVLYERISPMGALMDSAGPRVGEPSPRFLPPSLTGPPIAIGGATARAQLVFFLSPTCPVCKQLLPVLNSIRTDEKAWLDVVLASDGDEAKHRDFIRRRRLTAFPYVLSSELGMAYRVQRLPFAVLTDKGGVVRAKGLVNNREQLESLFSALSAGVPSLQQYAANHAAE
ncbi:methylamine dehydrogenase [Phenylobacterium sp.]|uniref:methylamine dehydrogenase n=1 Tax=Phenylobacterium sp. TaxID=1871053 RepID=UPI0025D0D276|nr:methylamine dehydrogenase [Phenylobacterium sp.]